MINHKFKHTNQDLSQQWEIIIVFATSRIVRLQPAIWCEPEFFVKGVTHLGGNAKNSGWQIALISFVTFLH